MASVHAQICLRAEGVSVLLDVAGGLPAIVHWGADLGDVSAEDFAALRLANVLPVTSNLADEPNRLALLPEHWTGWLGRPGISGSREGAAWSPKFSTTAVRLDGTSVGGEEDQPFVVTTGPGVVEVDVEDLVAELAVTLRIELAAGGVLRSQAVLTNTGSSVYDLQDLVLAYPVPPVAREILDFAGRWAKERVPQRRTLTVGQHLREGRKGRTGADAATVLHVGTPGFTFSEGEIWGIHTAWSGNHTHYAERTWLGQQVIGGGELLLPGEVRLGQGESYTSPWIYGSYGVGLDQVARRFHRFLRARPQHVDVHRPVTLNVWEAVYFDHSLDKLLALAEEAAELGVERYVLDDGWFGARRDDRAGLGDWTVSADVWPDGLHPLVTRVRELGMQFGLWFEPEMINLDSDTARAHPEWVMQTGDRLPIESRFQQVINLGIPECYAYIRDAIFAILDEYDISYIKWDHNRDLIDAGTHPAGRPGVHEQTLAFYRLVDEIKAAHPGLEIESCSSGGARVDLGVLERTDRVWASDCIDPLERQQIHRWTTQLIPPELIGSHIASGRSHTTGRVHDLSFRAGTALFGGHLGIEWDLTKATEAEMAQLREWIALYKAERDLLLRGDLVRIDFPDSAFMGQGVIAPDRSRALYSLAFVGSTDEVLLHRVPLPGLAPDRRYRIRPLIVGPGQHGLRPPPWWQVQAAGPGGDPSEEVHGLHAIDSRTPILGVELTGAALGSVGLTAPSVNPEQVLVYLAEQV